MTMLENKPNSDAVGRPLDLRVVPRWWRCDTHGEAMPHNAWGCPECVRELRVQVRQADERAAAAVAAERERWRQSLWDRAQLLVETDAPMPHADEALRDAAYELGA